MHGITVKGILAFIGVLVIIVVGIRPYFAFIFKKNIVSRAFLVGTIFFIAACYGAAQKGVLGKWVESWINLII